MKCFARQSAFWALAAVALFAAQKTPAADTHFVTSIRGIYEYNDNIFITEEDPFSDHIYTISPMLEWAYHSERYTLTADGMADFFHYQQNDELDSVSQWYNATVDATPTERWQVGAEAHASETNRPDRDIATTGIALTTVNRKRLGAGASAYYTFSEMLTAGMILDYNQENWDDPEISDNKNYHVVLTAFRPLDEWLLRTTGRVNLAYSHYAFKRDFQQTSSQGGFDIISSFDDQTQVDNLSLTVGTESAMTERLNMSIEVGGRVDQSRRELTLTRTYSPPLIEEPPIQTDADGDGYGFVGEFNLSYRTQRSNWEFLLANDLAPVSGSNATANRTTLRFGATMRLLERLRGNLFFQWYRNENNPDDVTQEDIDRRTWNAGGNLRWALNRYLDLAADYTYTIYERREIDTTSYRNRVLIRLEAHHDWLD